ncbi:MAG: hypothetical protein ORN98_01310, partial [Alphaproteobacteria bacterium]|nr:hypothetical protein [Alphaproteobacteria bacterium]
NTTPPSSPAESPKAKANNNNNEENGLVLTLATPFAAENLQELIAEMQNITGVTVKLRIAPEAKIMARLLHKNGEEVPDLILIPALGLLERAMRANLLQTLPDSAHPAIAQAAPTAHDAKYYWVGVARYAYGLAYLTPPDHELSRYENLAAPEWRGRVCTPNLSQANERAFMASRLLHLGSARTSQFFIAMAENDALIADPAHAGVTRYSSQFTSDQRIRFGLLGGFCDVALVNSRSLARLTKEFSNNDGNDATLARQFGSLHLIWPDEEGDNAAHQADGVSTDIIGLASPQASRKSERIQQAISQVTRYLLSETGQLQLADGLFAYPIRAGVPLSNEVARWGPFRADSIGYDRLLPAFDSLADLIESLTWH